MIFGLAAPHTLENIGVPALTKEKIEAIIARDKLGILSFMRSRGEGLTAPQIQAFERKRLEEKLAGDEYLGRG